MRTVERLRHDGRMPRTPSGAPTGRPPRTSRDDILRSAQVLLDRDGWEHLTIRRLAAEVGTSPATVYNHVRDKEDLLVQLLNGYAAEIPRAALPGTPRDRIAAAATLIHDALAARPWAVEILTADDLLGVDALWLVEAMVDGAITAGLSPEDAVHLYRSIWYYTAGEILIRAHRIRRRARSSTATYRDRVFAALEDTSAYPRLIALADRWPDLSTEDTYRQGLLALIDGALAGDAFGKR